MPELKTGSSIIKRKLSVKFLGVMFDENMSWKNHAKTTEKKTTKNIGLLHRAKPFLHEASLKTIFLAHIHSY